MKTRVKYILTMGFIGAILTVVIFPIMVYAQIPMMINYQGQLTDDMGVPLNGTYSMAFYLYDVAVDGSAIWSEPHPGVEVANGIYNVQLGSVTPFAVDDFDGAERYLEVVVAGETLSPRQRLTSVAFSIKAAVADAVVDGGITTVMIEDGTLTAADMLDGEVLAEIIDDDGAGSGLDADQLDGHEAGVGITSSAAKPSLWAGVGT